MKHFNLLLANFIADESGQDLIEYALVASAISLVAVATIGQVGTAVTNLWTSIKTSINLAPGAAAAQ